MKYAHRIVRKSFLCATLYKKQGCGQMNRYSVINGKNPREIILLRSHKCLWGRCSFCDYIEDNGKEDEEMAEENRLIIEKVEGKYKRLEVINSASVFELPERTLCDIRKKCEEKGIRELFFEAHYMYRERFGQIRDFFPGIKVYFKCGIESFDSEFRNGFLNKNVRFTDPAEPGRYFETACIMVGINGQTREMVDKDMEYLLKYFNRGCINIFMENSTPVKRDQEIIEYFRDNYSHLEEMENIEILWENSDFGVG